MVFVRALSVWVFLWCLNIVQIIPDTNMGLETLILIVLRFRQEDDRERSIGGSDSRKQVLRFRINSSTPHFWCRTTAMTFPLNAFPVAFLHVLLLLEGSCH